MLEYLQKLSRSLEKLRPFAVMFGVGFLTLTVLSLFSIAPFQQEAFLIFSIMGVLWSAMLFNFIQLFSHIPAKPNDKARFFEKVKLRIKRFFLYCLAMLFMVLTGGVIFLSLRLVHVLL